MGSENQAVRMWSVPVRLRLESGCVVMFTLDGKTYDSRTMGQYQLPQSEAIYIDHDHRAVFAQTLSADGGVVIQRATRNLLERYARRFELPELLSYADWLASAAV